MAELQRDYVHLAKLRLDWAIEGIDRLEVLVDDFLATKPCEVVSHVTRDGDNARISYVLRVYDQPPLTISLAAGDVVHNLRATLDNLVWGVGQVFGASVRLGLEFHDSESKFKSNYLPKINSLPETIKDWIRSVQPYNRQKFHRLNTLWNRDKHRTPTIINTAGIGDQMPIEGMTFHRGSSQEDQQEIAFAVIRWDRQAEFDPEFVQLVAFDVGGPIGPNLEGRLESVVPYLRQLQQYILANVVPNFEPFS